MKCRRCEKDALIGRAYCEDHIGKRREAQARYFERKKERCEREHLCRKCFKPLGSDTHKFCRACRLYAAEASTKYYREHRAQQWKVAGLKDVQCPAEYLLRCPCGYEYWCGESEKQHGHCPGCGRIMREVRL